MRAPTLTDGVVTLRAHRDADIAAVVEQCQDAAMQEWTTVPVPYSRDDAATYVRHLVPGGWETDREWQFAISTADADFVGSIGLHRRGDGRAEIGYGTHPAHRRRGHTERAARLLLAWGFAERDLQVVDWVAKRGNWPSRRLAWRLGFEVAGGRHWMDQRGTLHPSWYASLARGEELAPRHPWYDVPVLHGERVVLRPLRDDDLPGIVATQSDSLVRHFSEGARTRSPEVDHEGLPFVLGTRERAARGEALAWTVADPADGTYLGHVQLSVQHGRQAELGYMAHPAARGRGLTREAARLAVRHAVVPTEDGGLGLRRVQAWTAASNTASRRLLAALGTSERGSTRREVLLGDDSWDDEVVHDLLAADWPG